MIGRTNSKFIKIIEDAYNYGDGSLNNTLRGYRNHIAVNGDSNLYCSDTCYGNYNLNQSESSTPTSWQQTGIWALFETELFASYGNQSTWIKTVQSINPLKDKITVLNQFDGVPYTYNNNVTKRGLVSSGLNTKTFETPVTGNKTFGIVFAWGNLSGNRTISNLKFHQESSNNSNLYTVDELLDNEIIKPLVLVYSNVCSNIFNVYTAGTISGNWGHFVVMFMTNESANITGCQFNSSSAFSGGDGWMAGMTDIDNFRITYVDEEEAPL